MAIFANAKLGACKCECTSQPQDDKSEKIPRLTSTHIVARERFLGSPLTTGLFSRRSVEQHRRDNAGTSNAGTSNAGSNSAWQRSDDDYFLQWHAVGDDR